MTKGPPTVDRVSVGTSGWSYPSWRPGFYPAGLDPASFLGFYAERFRTVELNTTGYRLPAEDQFERWAAQAPDGFEFAPKLPGHRLRGLELFESRLRALGDRLGPVRVSLPGARDEGAVELLLGSLDPSLRLAFDLGHPSWDGIEQRLGGAGAARVNDLDHPAPFRYLRLRNPPYDDATLGELATRLRSVAEPVYVYFRHEDEPTAPAYAQRLLELLSA
ncbi:MAG TPA: DUF72 domain-containing protein [Gaiellaceae bacterium]|nr:DUF72 domain-containing protein [Gaiellaceae bacterium]